MPEEESVEEPKKAKQGLPVVIVLVVVGMLVLAGGAFLVVKFALAPANESQEQVAEEKGKDAKPKFGKLFSFDQAIVVNLAETNGQRYLKVNLQMEMSSDNLSDELMARSAQLMDLIITILSSKTIEEASTTVGRNRLKRELIDRINAELVTGKIVNIFFTEFVIQ